MKIIYNNIIPFDGFAAVNLFGVLFVRKGIRLTRAAMNHEYIHSEQIRELWYVLFYAFYLLEWTVKFFRYGIKSYYNISFEREAYNNAGNLDYLKERKRYSFLKYII